MSVAQLPAELHQTLATGLYIDEFLSIGWRLPASTQRTRLELLRAAIVLETTPIAEREEAKALGPEFVRIEAKLDVLLALLAQLVHAGSHPPEPTLCRLSNSGLLWRSPQELPPGTELSLETHLNDVIAVPLLLTAQVQHCHPHAEHWWIEAHFLFSDAETPDLLERWIFLRHRKQIAARLAKV
jgi:hypothetical protein